MQPDPKDTLPTKPRFHCRARGEFANWLCQSGGSLAISTYTSGKLVLVSSFDGRLHFHTRQFKRPMGMAVAGDRLALAVREQILLFQRGRTEQDSYHLRTRYKTGRVDAHDVAFGRRGLYFANTRFNAIARVSRQKNFVHCWQPSFVEGLIRDDRCHLNGLGMFQNHPRLVTAFCATGHAGGWRETDRFTGGVVIDIKRNEIVAGGLCMPHSPRWHNGQWWLCNSGHGSLETFDPAAGTRQPVCELPGFTRGLCFVKQHALVGLSRIRRKHILDAPPVRARQKNIVSGVALVDLVSGQMTGKLEFTVGGNEVYDVLFLPGITKPSLRLT